MKLSRAVSLVFVGVTIILILSARGAEYALLGSAKAVLPAQNQAFTTTSQSTTRVMNYTNGYYDGYYDGYRDGYKSGYKDGYNVGYNYTSAFNDAYKSGYAAGYIDGFNGRQPDIAMRNQEINQLHLIIETLAILLVVLVVLCIALYTHRTRNTIDR